LLGKIANIALAAVTTPNHAFSSYQAESVKKQIGPGRLIVGIVKGPSLEKQGNLVFMFRILQQAGRKVNLNSRSKFTLRAL
jgi:hypothetical protein